MATRKRTTTKTTTTKTTTTTAAATTTVEPAVEINLDTLYKYHDYWKESHVWLRDFINERSDEITTGVEIGVAFGSNMKMLLDETSLTKLWGVDTYSEAAWNVGDLLNVNEEFGSFDGLYQHILAMLKPYGTRAKIARMTSEEGSKKFKNESLDFIFIDGDHFDLENDLKYWERKVRDGGYIMGHDWNHPCFGNITQYLRDRYDEEQLVGIDGPVHIWYVQKGAFM